MKPHQANVAVVHTRDELGAALREGVATIEIAGALADLRELRLAPGQSLRGGAGAELRFAPGEDGVELTRDNAVTGLVLVTDPARRAVFNDPEQATLGRVVLEGLAITGNVRVLGTGAVRAGHFEAHDVHVVRADARGFGERPAGYGVEVVPGVFTLWNRQTDPASRITAELGRISIGMRGAPARGSGVFVGGTPHGGVVHVGRLETGEVHTDGGIAEGTPDRIAGGVFVVHGAWVDLVHNRGSVTTYGPNDMVLDNWGAVETWVAAAKVTSFGPSGIGFVNFGSLTRLRIDDVLETFGGGARGLNVYDGTLRDVELERVVTHGDGAVGIQIGRPVSRFAVRRGVETHGGTGKSLVKGVVKELSATALSVTTDGAVTDLSIAGGLVAHDPRVDPLEIQGEVEQLRIRGGLRSARGLASR